MDERKIKILEAIIRDYVQTGEPVGSRTIAKKYDLGVSSATIRNEMADLEDSGYLEQLHSSSGRIPSDLGYRLYVDKLMQINNLSAKEEFTVKNQLLTAALCEIDKIVKEATMILSDLTSLASIVKTPAVSRSSIKHIQLINIDKNNILIVIVTDTGIIKNSMIRIENPMDDSLINQLNILINRRLSGLTTENMDLEVISNLKQDLSQREDIFNALIPVLYESLKDIESSKVYSQGVTNILNYAEYNNIDKAKEFFKFINNEENVKALLKANSGKSITISIGTENFMEEAKDYTIITAIYGIEDRPLGTIGVVGPTRMYYDKVISVLLRITKELNDNIFNIYGK